MAVNICVLEDLRALTVIIPSTLARLDMFSQAILAVEQARILFNFEEGTKTHAMLDMLHASSII